MDILKELSGMFERRFVMNALLPATAFCGLLTMVVVLDRSTAADALKSWDGQTAFLKTTEILIAVITVLGTAGLISAAAMNILQFFEGYWPPFLQMVAGKKLIQWHQARLTRLAQEHAYQTIYFSYPPPTRLTEVMPTRLGNILKSSEIYASQRYNLDPVLIWPRLYSLLPEATTSVVGTLRSLIEFHLAVSVVAALFGVVSGVYLLVTGGNPLEFLLCFWGSMFVAWIAYRSSLSSVTAYAEQVKAAIDIYRNELLIKLRIPLPESPEQELATWQEVGVFLMRNLREHPEQWHYTDTLAGPPNA